MYYITLKINEGWKSDNVMQCAMNTCSYMQTRALEVLSTFNYDDIMHVWSQSLHTVFRESVTESYFHVKSI